MYQRCIPKKARLTAGMGGGRSSGSRALWWDPRAKPGRCPPDQPPAHRLDPSGWQYGLRLTPHSIGWDGWWLLQRVACPTAGHWQSAVGETGRCVMELVINHLTAAHSLYMLPYIPGMLLCIKGQPLNTGMISSIEFPITYSGDQPRIRVAAELPVPPFEQEQQHCPRCSI
jgi:hypothetical protein